jgi:hypothetical protein
MPNTIHATALGLGILVLLAGCGGRPDDAPTQAGQQRVPSSSARISSAPGASGSVTMQTPAGAASEDETTSLKQQVAILRREVVDIRQQLMRMPGAAATAEVSPNPRTDPAARAKAERVEQQRIAATEAAFRSENEDARWSQGSVIAIRAALKDADEALRNRVSGVECRSQSCRVVIAGDTGGSAGQELSSFMNRLALALPNVTAGQIDQGDGRPATVLYLSR